MNPRELKRRLTWLWRLSSSRTWEHVVGDGQTAALWVFDTAQQPDGGVLQPYFEAIARREQLRLRSFGPRQGGSFTESLRSIASFALRLGTIFHTDFDAEFANQVRECLVASTSPASPAVLLVGASKGTFAAIAAGIDKSLKVWEVQHGLLDTSYFPMSVQRFYARSRVSAGVVRELAPHVEVDVISQSLAPPEGSIEVANLRRVRELVCYSKNPGGGCTAEELATFESACSSAAERLDCRFALRLHLRDSVLKLLMRHRGLRPLRWVREANVLPNTQPRLVVSAYSTALVSESRKGDLIINVMIGQPSDITRREYQWVPTVSVASIRAMSETAHAFVRTN